MPKEHSFKVSLQLGRLVTPVEAQVCMYLRALFLVWLSEDSFLLHLVIGST